MIDNKILFFIFHGIPSSKQSARFTVGKSGKMKGKVVSYQKTSVKNKETELALIAESQLPQGFKIFDEPIGVSILYVFPILSSFTKKEKEFIENGGIIYKDTKPDLTDNLNKGLFDALQGVVYTNDSRIVKIIDSSKIYGKNPRTELTIFKLK